MKYSVDWLKAQAPVEYLFFWGHQPSRDGQIIKTCMSQWWKSTFVEDGVSYKTAEHYMMAKKALLFNDVETLKRILDKESPKDVKDLGKQVRDFDSVIWDQHKYQIVRQANLLKFTQNNLLKEFLMKTKSKVLVEASPADTVWGIGLAEDSPNANVPGEWRGSNLLGFALMEVRDEFNELK
jgi:ribA/ribD-fused uncharacterized protein